MVFDWDDFGANHVISDLCQTRDCRRELLILKEINPDFKATLFAVPGEMTPELLWWCHRNRGWIELAVHGFLHSSNYECEKMTYGEFDDNMAEYFGDFFVKGFKAPGWQISNDIYKWLIHNGWWVADQDYNTGRRPVELPAYINRNGEFFAHNADLRKDFPADWTPIEAWHGHTWNCMGNGIEETLDHVSNLVRKAKDFHFVSEVLK